MINEPGLYYVADPEGREARRVIASLVDGQLVTAFQLNNQPVDVGNSRVLGRAMAIFHAV